MLTATTCREIIHGVTHQIARCRQLTQDLLERTNQLVALQLERHAHAVGALLQAFHRLLHRHDLILRVRHATVQRFGLLGVHLADALHDAGNGFGIGGEALHLTVEFACNVIETHNRLFADIGCQQAIGLKPFGHGTQLRQSRLQLPQKVAFVTLDAVASH